MKTVIITGASGFLGQHLHQTAAAWFPHATLIPLASPRHGGLDLTQPQVMQQLTDHIPLPDPQNTLLIHAAAALAWNTPEALVHNAAMATHLATWAASVGLGFCVLVSSVSVWPQRSIAEVATPCGPESLYGLGKWTAEEVWRLQIARDRQAIVRLAGVWGWQPNPTLFWNRLLLAAARGSPPEPRLVIRRDRSLRNYLSVHDASRCLLGIGQQRQAGLWLAAGRDAISTASFLEALQALPGAQLHVTREDDGVSDAVIYQPSPELLPWLSSFASELDRMWSSRPAWV